MTTTETIEVGDYVKYHRQFYDGIAVAHEHGAGYVIQVSELGVLIRNGDRFVIAPLDDCVMHAKQTRLEI